MPRVSIILPTHNRPELLAEAVSSVQAQTFADWELLIVDDASKPAVEALPSFPRIQVLHHMQSKGGAAAKNTGISKARGAIVAFLDDDDLYAPEYLARAIEVLDRNPKLDLVFMGVKWFGARRDDGQRSYDRAMDRILAETNGRRLGDGVIEFGEELVEALLKTVPMAFQRPVVRRSALQRIGGYQPDCLLWDCDWAIRAAVVASSALVVEGLYQQRADGQGYSSKGDRWLEHLRSNVEIKERLLRHTRLGSDPPPLASKFRAAAAGAWFSLAWHHYQHGDRKAALAALWQSERRQISVPRLKLLARLLRSIQPRPEA